MIDLFSILIMIITVICLVSPVVCLVGFIVWLIGKFQGKDVGDSDNKNQLLGKKIMLYALLTFLIGLGSCWGLISIITFF